MRGFYDSATGGTLLDGNIKAATSSAKSAVSTAYAVRGTCESTYMQMTATPKFIEDHKDTMLDFRRRYKLPIIAFVSGISVVPALMAGPGKAEKLRVAVRNLFLVGGSASVLMYPELVFRAAPAASRAVDTAEAYLLPKVSK